ncbi:unnamed protein product [Adineta ricciae]|uniref:Uncharacterized protein n=1 Tax=Adineta ricciae TaxID=249248 RepID=A0A815VFQ2_ADIRI|nr:unnamed protein product [Adineta ricciae]
MAKANLSTTALVMAPTAIEARAGLNLQRRKAMPALPVSIDFYISRCYKMALNGERFLLADHLGFKPTKITTDFESALINVIKAEVILLLSDPPESWNNRFNKRMNKTHPNMWAFIACLQAEEVIFRQVFLKFKAGAQKKIMLNTLTMQKHIDNLNTRFNNNEIDRVELLDGLSLLAASKK